MATGPARFCQYLVDSQSLVDRPPDPFSPCVAFSFSANSDVKAHLTSAVQRSRLHAHGSIRFSSCAGVRQRSGPFSFNSCCATLLAGWMRGRAGSTQLGLTAISTSG